jgi:flagellar biosynthesis/type III secretory pathway chaperone
MTDKKLKFEFDALDDLLEAERAALLSGDLEKLTRMFEGKEALINALNDAEHADLEALQTLDGKLKRNQQLLDGALEGIRSVARRMAALRRIRGSLDTYGSDGKKQSITIDADPSVEKRA